MIVIDMMGGKHQNRISIDVCPPLCTTHGDCHAIMMEDEDNIRNKPAGKRSILPGADGVQPDPLGDAWGGGGILRKQPTEMTMESEKNDAVFDARGNGDGETANTITGDHADRITDYTPVVCRDEKSHQDNEHALEHDESKAYPCAKCGNDPESMTVELDELIDVKTGIEIELFGCRKCGQNFGILKEWNKNQVQIKYMEKVLACIDGDKINKKERKGGSGLGVADGDVMYTQTAKDVHAVAVEPDVSKMAQMTVRRLLPIETERLMGFPDFWTQIPWKGKPAEECPDSPRYKACGNSMCVNCMEWLGRRIQMEEERIKAAEREKKNAEFPA